MINWELEDKTIHISKDGIASERNYYKYKDWEKWESSDGNERNVCIATDKAPLSCVADNEREALLNMLEECDKMRRVYSDLADEIKELLEMEGESK